MNHRPSGYEPDELPGCSIPRRLYYYNKQLTQLAEFIKKILGKYLSPPQKFLKTVGMGSASAFSIPKQSRILTLDLPICLKVSCFAGRTEDNLYTLLLFVGQRHDWHLLQGLAA